MILTDGQKKLLNNNNEIIEVIKEGVALYFGVDPNIMHQLKKSRSGANMQLKQFVVYTCKMLAPKLSFDFIGKKLGGFDHATILHSYKVSCNLVETDPSYKMQMYELINVFVSGGEYSDDFKRILSEMYYYMDLDSIKVLRISKEHSIIFSGVKDDVITKIKSEFFPSQKIVVEELKNTGLSILGKKRNLLHQLGNN